MGNADNTVEHEDDVAGKANSELEKRITELHAEHKDRVFRRALRFLRRRDEAEDLVQVVYLNLIRYVRRVGIDAIRNPEALIQDLTSKAIADRYRTDKSSLTSQLDPRAFDESTTDPSWSMRKERDFTVTDDQKRQIMKNLGALPRMERICFVLTNIYEFSHDDLMDITGFKKHTLETYIVKAKKLLLSLSWDVDV